MVRILNNFEYHLIERSEFDFNNKSKPWKEEDGSNEGYIKGNFGCNRKT